MVGGMCSLLPYGTGVCRNAFTFGEKNVCVHFFLILFFNLV